MLEKALPHYRLIFRGLCGKNRRIMRIIKNLNTSWDFFKNTSNPEAKEGKIKLDLPHTWNGEDGQDGGGDYFRGSCVYSKLLKKAELPKSEKYFLEFLGANSSADVFIDGKKLCHHDGGYSTFRVDITDALCGESRLSVVVDNSANDKVYPQMADFTFYGGLYRSVNLICVPKTHFELEYFGTPGIKVTPTVKGSDCNVEIEVYTKDLGENDTVKYTVTDRDGTVIFSESTNKCNVNFTISDVHLWNGRIDPYLYSAKAEILRDGEVLDGISTRFGCRSFEIDPDRGFILNGREYPLRGVSRHQDRKGIGNALLPEHHREDIDLILEVGAATVRLAHYQHDAYFYDLCDETGLIVWAEIPYISKHMEGGRENTVSQMTELIVQNYNHPSIVVWGLSNEISIGGSSEDLLENHRILNDLCHKLDKTRKTVIAAVSMCKIDDPYLKIPDAVSYNHYFGWYGGEADMNGPWFDKFHREHPDIPIGCSEYGCEALDWHTSNPVQGDYTEEYQAYYHEELIKQLFKRKYLWATHVWNMFDFGADSRAEGGENGQNHKGLLTIDRKYKKDAFYAYKAWLVSPEKDPFVHICSKRYVDRAEDLTRVKIYSNLPEVELFVNGSSVGKKRAEDHFFSFEVKNEGESELVAKAGDFTDKAKIRKVEKPNTDYVLKEKGAVLNWFDIDAPEGSFSLNDKISDIMKTEDGRTWFIQSFAPALKKKGEEAKKSQNKSGGFEVDLGSGGGLMEMMSGFTVLRLTAMMAMMNVSFTKEELLSFNKQLNSIKK